MTRPKLFLTHNIWGKLSENCVNRNTTHATSLSRTLNKERIKAAKVGLPLNNLDLIMLIYDIMYTCQEEEVMVEGNDLTECKTMQKTYKNNLRVFNLKFNMVFS